MAEGKAVMLIDWEMFWVGLHPTSMMIKIDNPSNKESSFMEVDAILRRDC